ncbi:hypothetical protein GLYMA_10G111750v4 [Glycine max]|nr:hypothetical protein GLYMA_10G111750v4 [Glycine max]KAH1137747.1 hypothetical protein GYH30_027654 [Glycine max]
MSSQAAHLPLILTPTAVPFFRRQLFPFLLFLSTYAEFLFVSPNLP